MKRYDLSKIMKAAHQIKKYMKLYSLTHGIKTWADCLKLAWANEKRMVADEEARNAEKEAMWVYGLSFIPYFEIGELFEISRTG